jgi:hypothetical protein
VAERAGRHAAHHRALVLEGDDERRHGALVGQLAEAHRGGDARLLVLVVGDRPRQILDAIGARNSRHAAQNQGSHYRGDHQRGRALAPSLHAVT